MRKILFWVFLLILFNVAAYYFLTSRANNTLVTVGDEADLSLFKKEKVLLDPSLGGRLVDVSQYNLRDNSLFLALLGIQATFLVGYLFSARRLKVPTNFQANTSQKSNILCLGLGGSGKTTLINNNLLDNRVEPKKTEKFHTYTTLRHVSNKLTELTIYDYQGQDIPTLVREILAIENQAPNINHLIVILSIVPSRKDGADWVLDIPDDLETVVGAQFVSDQCEQLSYKVVSVLTQNMANLQRVSILYNQIDLFADQSAQSLRFDQSRIRRIYDACFDTLRDEFAEVRRNYDDKYRTKPTPGWRFWDKTPQDRRLQVDYHYVSLKWGIELDIENAEIKPMVHSLLSK